MILTKWQSWFWYKWPRFSKDWEKSKTSYSAFLFSIFVMWPNWQSSRKKEDLVKSGYRLDIKIKKFKNDDQSGPIFFLLKNPLCVCVCVWKLYFPVRKMQKFAQEKPLLPVFLFWKLPVLWGFWTGGSLILKYWKNLELMVVCFFK